MAIDRGVVVRVLVVDDHPVFRKGLQAVLADDDAVELVGGVGTGAEAVATALAVQPDVVLLDLHLPDLDGVEVMRQLSAGGFAGAVLVLTMYDDELALVAALDVGAKGYLLKGGSQAEIVAGVRTVYEGGMVFGGPVATKVASRLVAAGSRTQVPGLSSRELEVLTLMAQGRSNTEITRLLVLSDKTVRNHISSIYAKLGVSDRLGAIERARRAGLDRIGETTLPWQR